MAESVDRDKHIIATYYIEDSQPDVDIIDHLDLIQTMVLQGSTGSWIQVKEETEEVRQRLAGKLVGYYEVPAPQSTKKAIIQLGFPIAAFERNVNVPAMLLSFAGNCFAFPDKLRLLDVWYPKELVQHFKGPKFGVEGIREITGVKDRPLILHIIKPKMGMTPEDTAKQAYETALEGVDIIKDDEMCTEPFNSSFEDRLEAVTKALELVKKKTGKRALYLISVTDEVDRIGEKARKAVKGGASGFLLAYSAGLSALRILAEDPEVNVPILLHPAHMMALLPTISFTVLAKTIRLCGADMMLTPSMWSSTPLVSYEETYRTAQVLATPFFHIKRSWPMPAGGMYPGLVPTLVKEFGPDIIIPAGGGILGHPQGYASGVKAWFQAIEAAMNDIPLEEAAKDMPELRAAIETWGVLERPKTYWNYLSPKYSPEAKQAL